MAKKSRVRTSEEISKLLEQRILELAFTPIPELPPQLRRLGLQCQLTDSEEILIDNGFMRVGFCETDPVSKAIQLGFAIAGPLWASALPNLLPEVKKEWKIRSKKSRSRKG